MSKRTSLLVVLLLLGGGSHAQDKSDVYFVAIGSGSYMTPSKTQGFSDVKGLPAIPGAAKSAVLIADLLHRGGAKFGVTVVSDDSHYVGRDDIVDAISTVFKEIKKAHPRHPLVVVYFAGHGVADGMTWDHFSLPGNFLYHGNLIGTVSYYGAGAANLGVNASILVAWLLQARVPFLVLLDTCFEGQPNEFVWKPVAPTANASCGSDISGFCGNFLQQMKPVREFDEQMKQVTKDLNEMAANRRRANRFENTYPVIFSAQPGNSVTTVPEPFQQDPRDRIAPLARRALLTLDPLFNRKDSLSLKGFIEQMVTADLDQITTPAVTYTHLPPNADSILIDGVGSGGRVESRLGSATKQVVCCDMDSELMTAREPVYP